MMFKFIIAGSVPAVAAGLWLTLASPLAAGDWTQWRGPDRTGISTETNWLKAWPADGPQVLWRAKVGVGYSSVAIAQGRLYTLGNTDDVDHVYCLDAQTGKPIWQHDYPCVAKDPNGYHGTRCTPTVDGDRVYVLSRAGQLFCLNTTDGKPVWSKDYKTDFKAKPPTWGYAASPLVEGQMLIIEPGGPGTAEVALDKATGKVLWQAGDDPAAYSSPVAFTWQDQRGVASLNARGIVARRVSDGTELWRHPWKTAYDVNAATPIIAGDKVFISSGYNAGCLLLQFSATPPKVLWQNTNMRNHVNSCVLWQGFLYGFDERELRCLDWETGAVKWSEKKYGKGSLTLAGDKFLVYSDRGRVAVADLTPAAGTELAGMQVLEGRDTWPSPILARGLLYCRNLEDLVCLDVRGK